MSLKFIKTNVGFYNSKTISRDGTCKVYKTMIQQSNVSNNQCIEIDGVRYQVGYGTRDISEKNESKTHIICTYYNILSNCDDGDEVVLITVLPMKNFLNDDYVQVYKNTFLQTPKIKGIVDGVSKSVTLIDVIVYMEGASVVNLYDEVFDDKTIGLIDIGGNTINVGVFVDGELNVKTAHTMPLGTIKLERKLIDELDKKLNWSIQTYEVADIFSSEDANMRKVVDEVCIEFVNDIFNSLLEYNWNVYNLKLFCTGGGSKLLQKYLADKFKYITFSKNAIFDNVNGLGYIEELIQNDYKEKH